MKATFIITWTKVDELPTTRFIGYVKVKAADVAQMERTIWRWFEATHPQTYHLETVSREKPEAVLTVDEFVDW